MLLTLKKVARALIRPQAPHWAFRALNPGKKKYRCPICDYAGPFRDTVGRWTSKKNSQCPKCGSTERIRALWLAIEEAVARLEDRKIRLLHFASEAMIRPRLRQMVDRYETSSFDRADADHAADLRALPFADNSYDMVIACHVLEHIMEDHDAIREIERVLTPGGIAILPVPVSGETTVEYDAPRPEEAGHVRAPGRDYFDRYRAVFGDVTIRTSEDYSEEFHLISEMQEPTRIQFMPLGHPEKPLALGGLT